MISINIIPRCACLYLVLRDSTTIEQNYPLKFNLLLPVRFHTIPRRFVLKSFSSLLYHHRERLSEHKSCKLCSYLSELHHCCSVRCQIISTQLIFDGVSSQVQCLPESSDSNIRLLRSSSIFQYNRAHAHPQKTGLISS